MKSLPRILLVLPAAPTGMRRIPGSFFLYCEAARLIALAAAVKWSKKGLKSTIAHSHNVTWTSRTSQQVTSPFETLSAPAKALIQGGRRTGRPTIHTNKGKRESFRMNVR